jgi:predicted DNA-binding transcriptional regulator AlpA
MALILTSKKKSTFRNWYAKNKHRLSQERKQRYAQDPEYRQRALEASRRRRRGESTLRTRPEGFISFSEAKERIGVSLSALYEWKKREYFPEPKVHSGRFWFSEKQVLLLTKLKEVIRVYGKRRGKVKQHQLKEMVTLIGASWD